MTSALCAQDILASRFSFRVCVCGISIYSARREAKSLSTSDSEKVIAFLWVTESSVKTMFRWSFLSHYIWLVFVPFVLSSVGVAYCRKPPFTHLTSFLTGPRCSAQARFLYWDCQVGDMTCKLSGEKEKKVTKHSIFYTASKRNF